MTAQRDDSYRLRYAAHRFDDGEQTIDSWTAARGAGLTSAGGKLVLTSARLLFEPIRAPKGLIGPVSKLFGMEDVGTLVAKAVDAAGTLEPWSLLIGLIRDVSPSDAEHLQVTATNGEVWSFRIAAGLFALNGGHANRTARDQAVAKIRSVETGRMAGSVIPREAPDVSSTLGGEAILRAVMTGQTILLDQSDGIRMQAEPDGAVHFYWGDVARSVTRSIRQDLVGIYTDDEQGFRCIVDASGRISGHAKLFGALPPLPMREGFWWWDDESETLQVSFGFWAPLTPPFAFHVALQMSLRYLGPEVVVLRPLLSDELSEDFVVKRVRE